MSGEPAPGRSAPGGSAPGRSARLHAARDLRLHDGPALPAPAEGRVTLRITAVGLCGSDLHWYTEGAIGSTSLVSPLVMGHEFSAVIEGGPRDGERVAVDPADLCEGCDLCRSGRGRLCGSMRFAGQPPDDGALRTRLDWAASRCFPLPASVPDHEAPLLETLGIAVHALDLAAMEPGMTAGVYGAGPIGLVLVRALRAAGVSTIVATDRLPHRVAAAEASGASTALLVEGDHDPAAAIGVDVAFECAGDPGALVTAMRAVRPGGSVMLVGIPDGDETVFPASLARRKELTLRLVRRMEAPDLPRAIELVRSGAVRLDGLVTHRFGLEDAPAAFELAAARRGLKVVVEPEVSA